MKYSSIVVSPLPNHAYKVKREIVYRDITVPVGYRTNGADIPRLFWSIIPPNRSDILPAVLIHDYLCDLGEYEKADEYFKEILELLRVRRRDVWILHTAVSLYTRYIR